jgi:membrane protease YdiL (CAAX protease family)
MANYNRISITMTRSERWLGLFYFLFQLYPLPWLLNQANSAIGTPLSAAWLNFIFFCINFICVFSIFHRFLGRSLSHLGKNLLGSIKGAFLGFCVYYVSNIALGSVIVSIFPWFSNVNDQSVAAMLQLNYLPMVIGTVFLVPMVEEMLHRGVIFQWLYCKNHTLGYVVSVLVFCAVHVMGYWGRFDYLTLFLCFIQYIPAGLCLAWSYTQSDNIFAPILMHTVINAMGVAIMR